MCFNIEKGLMEAIAIKFVPEGFKLFPTNNLFTSKKILYTQNINMIIADIFIESKKEINAEFLKWINTTDQKHEYKKIILSNITDEYNIRRLMEMGINSFISKKNQTNIILNKLETEIKKLSANTLELRKHVRVNPDPSENPSVVFYANEDKISGKIVNISMGGVLVKTDEPYQLIAISKLQKIPRMQLTLKNKKVILDAVVIIKKKDLLAMKFSNINEVYKDTLSKYIFNKISKV